MLYIDFILENIFLLFYTYHQQNFLPRRMSRNIFLTVILNLKIQFTG